MRFKGRMELEQGLKPIDILPLLNIIFLLLIFLMLIPNFFTHSTLKLNLPRAFTSEAVGGENIIEISVDSIGAVYLNGNIIDRQGLKNFLGELRKRNPSVLIKADRRISLGQLAELWDLIRASGIARINIATNQE